MAVNFREGMRRLGAVLGVVGAVGGGYLGYLSGIEEVDPISWAKFRPFLDGAAG